MKRYIIHIVLLLFLTIQLHSQENGVVAFKLPVRNSLKFNKYALNPTFSFVRESNKYISVTNKKQWIQFENAPETYLVSYSGRFSENTGVGVGVFQQNNGVFTNFGGILNFAYNAVLDRDSNLTFGANIAYYQSGINQGSVITNFPDSGLNNVENSSVITINPGLNYGTMFFDFGVSVNNLVSYNLNASELIEEDPEQSIQGHILYTGFMQSRGFFDNSKFSGLLRSEFQKEQTIVSGIMMLTVPKGIWGQVGYNTLYGASIGLGLNISDQIALEYNYEQSMGELSEFGNSHEITLAYRFKKKYRYNYSDDEKENGLFSSSNRRRKPAKRKGNNKITESDNERFRANRIANAKLKEERKAQYEAAQKAKAEEEAKAKELAVAQAKAEEEAKAEELAVAQAKAEEEAKAQELAVAQAKAEEEAKAKELAVAQAKAEEEAKAKELAVAQAKAEEETKARELAVAQAKAEEEAKGKELAVAQAKAEEEAKAKELAVAQAKAEEEAKAKELAVAQAKAKELAVAQAKAEEETKAKELAVAQAKAEEEAKAKELAVAQAKAEEETKARELAVAQAKAEEEAKARELAVAQAKAEEEAKAKELAVAQAKAEEEAKAKELAVAQAKAEEETKAKELAVAQAKAEEEAKAKELAVAQAKAEEEAEAKELAAAQAKAEEEAKAKELAVAQAKAEEEAEAKELAVAQAKAEELVESKQNTSKAENIVEAIGNGPVDTATQAMIDLTKLTDESKIRQEDLLSRLNEAMTSKQKDLDDLKQENDLRDQGIVSAPKPFKSVSAENAALEALKLEIEDVITTRSENIKEIEDLYNERLKKVKSKTDKVNMVYLDAIELLYKEQTEAKRAKQSLVSTLERIKIATDFERKRRIKKAAYDNEEDRYIKDRAALNSIKQFTDVSETPLTVDDFDFGDIQSNIQIVKGVKNAENGYYMVVAVHSDVEKRDVFLAKAVAAGESNIDFFYDVNSSKYFIYYQKYDNIETASRVLENKENLPYNSKMSMVKIEN